LTSEERVAIGAHLSVDLFTSRTGLPGIATGASYDCVCVERRVNILLH